MIISRHYAAEPKYGENDRQMVSSGGSDADGLPQIGLWLDDGELVGVCTYDTALTGHCFFAMVGGYERPYPDMIRHAESHLAKDGAAKLLIRDGDELFARASKEAGYRPTQEKDCDAVFDIGMDRIACDLPKGFSVVSMKDRYDVYECGFVTAVL